MKRHSPPHSQVRPLTSLVSSSDRQDGFLMRALEHMRSVLSIASSPEVMHQIAFPIEYPADLVRWIEVGSMAEVDVAGGKHVLIQSPMTGTFQPVRFVASAPEGNDLESRPAALPDVGATMRVYIAARLLDPEEKLIPGGSAMVHYLNQPLGQREVLALANSLRPSSA